MTRTLPVLSLALVIATACAGGHDGATDADVVLLTVDDLRLDRTTLEGGDLAVPSLERLVANGTRFTDAATPTPMLRPAISSLLTGVTPDRTGVRDDIGDRLGDEFGTVAEAFQASGRATAAFVGSTMLGPEAGLARGFAVYDGVDDLSVGPGRYFPENRPGTEIAENLGTWLDTVGEERRIFAWVHLADLHGLSTDGARKEDPGSLYDDGVVTLDAAVGAVLDALAARGRGEAHVLLVGTRGAYLGEDGRRGSSHWLARETLRIPLLSSRRIGGERVGDAVWTPDVASTLFAWAGTPVDLEDCAPLASKPGADRVRRAWTWAADDELAWPPWSAVELDGTWHAFDHDAIVAAGSPDRALTLVAERPATPRDRRLPDELQARIDALELRLDPDVEEPENIDWSRAAVPFEGEERDAFLSRIMEVRHNFSGGHSRRSARKSARLLNESGPTLEAVAMRLLIGQAVRAGGAAHNLAVRALEAFPNHERTLHWAGHVLEVSHGREAATALIEAAITIGPEDADLHYDLACLHSLGQDLDRSLEHLRNALDSGYTNREWIDRDADLANLRADPRFTALMREFGS